jgi:predicted transcriptional regulator
VSSGEPNQNSSEKQTQKLDLYALARIIESLKEHGATSKTALATSTGIAYDRLGKYLSWMTNRGFITIQNLEGKETVLLTTEGLKAYEEFVSWILKYVGRIRFPKI